MSELMEPVLVATVKEECIFCHKKHKETKEKKLSPHTYKRDDKTLTAAGQAFIKGDSERSKVYPRDDDGGFVSPLVPAVWDENTIFKTYETKSGKQKAHAAKYQLPPIKGWIAAPHHMVAICCLNGENGLSGKPKSNPWAKKGSYDVNNGGNCIFLPSSASQFYVAYYYWKVRGTGQALQGHLGAHRKNYFIKVWDKLERIVSNIAKNKSCTDTSTEENKDELAKIVVEEIKDLEGELFLKLASLKPEECFKLGAESYIEIPDATDEFGVPSGVVEKLQPYELLPQWY